MSEEIKKIVENAKSEDELLENLDKVDRKLSEEELEAVSGGVGNGSSSQGCYPSYYLDH